MPQLVTFKHGRRWEWSAEEDNFIKAKRTQGVMFKDIAAMMGLSYRLVQQRSAELGLTRRNNILISQLFDDEYDTLVELSKDRNLTRDKICEKLNVTAYHARLLRDIIDVIRAHNQFAQRGINTRVSSRGRLTYVPS